VTRPEVLRAGFVLPIDGDPIADGAVAVEDGRIAWVGPANASSRPGWPERDLGPGVLLPGFVNAHTHLELSALAGKIDGARGFTGWVEALVEARPQVSRDAGRAAAQSAITALSECGTVAVGDVSNALDHLDLFEATPLRAVVFFEQLAWDPARAAETLTRAEARLSELRTPGNVEVRLAAHAPHSVSEPLLRAMAALGGPAALHLAESPDETRFLKDGGGPWAAFLRQRVGDVPWTPPGQSPVAYGDRVGVLHARLVAAHCVQVDATDVALLAARDVSVVACPRSNRTLGVGVPPVPALLEAGVNVALGTDSLASAPSLDVRDDARALRREFPALPAAAIVRAATLGGARALGFDDLGVLAPGRRAALAYASAASRPADPEAHVLADDVALRRLA
jgi:cytosine/adenosine deaminase-related metal-dependent hydrolase